MIHVRNQADIDSLPTRTTDDITVHLGGDVVLRLLEESGDIYADAATSCNINGVDMNTPDQERAALARVAPIILADDGRWDQGTFGPDQCPTPECGTPMCLAGWLRATGRPEVRRFRVQVAGMLEAPGAYRAGAFHATAGDLVRRLCREAVGA